MELMASLLVINVVVVIVGSFFMYREIKQLQAILYFYGDKFQKTPQKQAPPAEEKSKPPPSNIIVFNSATKE